MELLIRRGAKAEFFNISELYLVQINKLGFKTRYQVYKKLLADTGDIVNMSMGHAVGKLKIEIINCTEFTE